MGYFSSTWDSSLLYTFNARLGTPLLLAIYLVSFIKSENGKTRVCGLSFRSIHILVSYHTSGWATAIFLNRRHCMTRALDFLSSANTSINFSKRLANSSGLVSYAASIFTVIKHFTKVQLKMHKKVLLISHWTKCRMGISNFHLVYITLTKIHFP